MSLPSFDDDLNKFREIAEFTLLSTKVDMTPKGANAAAQFLKVIDGASVGEGVMSLLTLIRCFVEDWRKEEKILAGPVQ